MTDDLIRLARQYHVPAGAHYANCEADHLFCLLLRMADEIERLHQRLAAVQEESDRRTREIEACYVVQRDLKARLAEAERDAARYRFLQAESKRFDPVLGVTCKVHFDRNGSDWCNIVDLDATVDRCRATDSATVVQYKPCEICTTQSWCETHGCQCYPVSAVQPERCCLDYPRCDCNSPPEPDNEWHCSQYPGLEDDIKKYRDAALAGAAVQPIAVTGNCGLCGQPRADHAEVAPDGKPECRMKENSHHG